MIVCVEIFNLPSKTKIKLIKLLSLWNKCQSTKINWTFVHEYQTVKIDDINIIYCMENHKMCKDKLNVSCANFYTENYKTLLLRNSKQNLNKWRGIPYLWFVGQNC